MTPIDLQKTSPEEAEFKASTLIELLPWLKQYRDEIVVVKYGGNAMISEELQDAFAEDIAYLRYVGIQPVVVHGGGQVGGVRGPCQQGDREQGARQGGAEHGGSSVWRCVASLRRGPVGGQSRLSPIRRARSHFLRRTHCRQGAGPVSMPPCPACSAISCVPSALPA